MRNNENKRKTMLIFVLISISLIMVIGFAAFNSTLTINGTASTNPNWCIGFDNRNTSAYTVTKVVQTGTSPTGSIGFSGTACSTNYVPVASLGATFYQPGDKIEYTLTIANKGSINAVIESITVDNTSVTSDQTIQKGNIIWKVHMPADVTLAASTGTTTMVVSAEFQNTTDLESYTAQETQSITVGIVAAQNTGSNAMITTPATQQVYAFNTNYIFKDSSTLQDIGTTYGSCAATGKESCLRYTLENYIVTGVDVCFVKGGTEYCLKGLHNESSSGTTPIYDLNVGTLNTAFTEANACTSNSSSYGCSASGIIARARVNGSVETEDGGGYWSCSVSSVYNRARCSGG